jgi:phosphoglycolate phosphatase-like HAD superfamily hydrolase
MQAIVFDIDHTIFDANHMLRDGVADLLAILSGLGVRLGAISGNDHRAVVRLDEAGIRHHFAQVWCADHNALPKSTEALHCLLERLGAELHQATLVSHAHADILLGREAGVGKTIGVSHGKDIAALLKQAGADHVASNIPAILDVLE